MLKVNGKVYHSDAHPQYYPVEIVKVSGLEYVSKKGMVGFLEANARLTRDENTKSFIEFLIEQLNLPANDDPGRSQPKN